MNQKELNYCLRYHTYATIRYLGLKVEEQPMIKKEIDLIDIDGNSYGKEVVCTSCTCRVFGYAGTCPNTKRCSEAVTVDEWIAQVYFG